MTPHPAAASRPLLVTSDGYLLDELVRIAAGAGVVLDVAPDVPAARSVYPTAPLVLVGIDLAAACVRARLAPRRGVVVVGCFAGDGPPDWGVADHLRAEHIAVLPLAEPWLARRLMPEVSTPADQERPDGAALTVPGLRLAEWANGERVTDTTVTQEPVAAPSSRSAVGRPSAAVGVARRRGLLIAVVGGRGGAGASVLATGLAVTAARGGVDTLLVDADPLGGGLDLLLGWEELDGSRWPALAALHSGTSLVDTLPREASLSALSFDRSPAPRMPVDALATALASGRRQRDLVVVDIPRRFDDGAALALAEADAAFLVVPAELRACAAAARVAEVVRRHCDRLSLIVRGPAPGGLAAQDVTAALGLPFAGYLRSEPAIARDLDSGVAPARDGRGPLAALCRRLLADLGITSGREAA